jgi:hypothetical protein
MALRNNAPMSSSGPGGSGRDPPGWSGPEGHPPGSSGGRMRRTLQMSVEEITQIVSISKEEAGSRPRPPCTAPRPVSSGGTIARARAQLAHAEPRVTREQGSIRVYILLGVGPGTGSRLSNPHHFWKP